MVCVDRSACADVLFRGVIDMLHCRHRGAIWFIHSGPSERFCRRALCWGGSSRSL